MRETRTCGSEGGETLSGLPYPYRLNYKQMKSILIIVALNSREGSNAPPLVCLSIHSSGTENRPLAISESID